jgi:uncharacterized protein YyaL (SSP411 family)
MHKYSNSLVHETSPYLLQHAHNPVNWFAWGNEALEKAKRENKLLLISIGYSACHWCHVMEHESFENEVTATIMNEQFICIKVDREERPDIDQVYMHAVQLMTGQGGWPLNCLALPDGRPIYGGTYFRNSDWNSVLKQISLLYKSDPMKCEQYASELTEGIKQRDQLAAAPTENSSLSIEDLKKMVVPWKELFDKKEGGHNYAPKFPMPSNLLFLLRYYSAIEDKAILNHVELSLDKMAFGGIYDQLGGGFSRYATDMLWKVPHFEKMLYDNGQLVSLYAEAYQLTKKPLYKQVVYETLEFVARELTAPEGGFYAALDADSEGEEGKYYVWKKDELEVILGDLSNLFFEYYNVNETGYWEHDNYILLRKESDATIAERFEISVDDLQKRITVSKRLLLKEREKRIRPGLDDKQLTSWNALMLKGYIDAYAVFHEADFLKVALKNAQFLLNNLKNGKGYLYHNFKNGHANINGYLEDYAFTIEAFIALYEVTFDEKWLEEAKQLMTYAILHFYDSDSGHFYFTSDIDPALITRKKEIQDNVIPASNSCIAKCLFKLGLYFNVDEYNSMVLKMIQGVKTDILMHGSGYSNWGIVLIHLTQPFFEIAITGKKAEKIRKELNAYYIPNKIIAGSFTESKIPLLQNRFHELETMIYVCYEKSCKMPVKSVEEALTLLNSSGYNK